MDTNEAIAYVNDVAQTHVPSSCWDDVGYLCGSGYRGLTLNKKKVYAHRLFFELLSGPIPEGLELDHLCSNCTCVNPAHLEPVTHHVNALRASHGPSIHNNRRRWLLPQANAVLTHCPQGHAYDGDNLYVYPSGARRCRKCARAQLRQFRARKG